MDQLSTLIDAGPDALLHVIQAAQDNARARDELFTLMSEYMARRFCHATDEQAQFDRPGYEAFITAFREPLKKIYGGQGYNGLFHTASVLECMHHAIA